MLADCFTTYAPGEAQGNAPYSKYQDVSILGRYHLDQLKSPNIVIGLAVLLGVAYFLHRRGRK